MSVFQFIYLFIIKDHIASLASSFFFFFKLLKQSMFTNQKANKIFFSNIYIYITSYNVFQLE